jgi:hypothetical protein
MPRNLGGLCLLLRDRERVLRRLGRDDDQCEAIRRSALPCDGVFLRGGHSHYGPGSAHDAGSSRPVRSL